MDKYRDYEEVLRARYYHLYGESDCEFWLQQEKKKTLIKVVIVILLFTILIYNDVSSGRAEYSNVRFNDKGEIISAVRPDEGEDSYSFTARVKIKSEGRESEKEYYITIEPAGEKEAVQD